MISKNNGFGRAVVRRVIFAGLVILGAWFLLLWLRGHIPKHLIDLMNADLMGLLSTNSTSWD